MSAYRIYHFGLAGELVATAEVDCLSDDCAVAELAAARHAAPAVELWHGERLLKRTGGLARSATQGIHPSPSRQIAGTDGTDASARASNSREDLARVAPAEDFSISMFAHVVGLLPRGGRRVRLANAHELDVLGVAGCPSEVSLIGDVVTIELAPGQLQGWRLA